MIRYISVFFVLFMFMHGSLSAADLSVLEKSAKADLEQSLKKLSALRNKIAAKKIPLARKIRIREERLRSLRRQVIKIQELQDSKIMGLEDLRRDLKGWRDENMYISNLLGDYERGLEQNLTLAEYGGVANNGKITGQGADDLTARLQLLDFGLDRLRQNIGGRVFEGKAIAENGDILGGRFVRLGPLVYFISNEDDKAGPLQDVPGAYAHFVEFSSEQRAELQKLVRGEVALLSLDITGGKATAIATTQDGLLDHVGKGGIWIIPILIFALVSIVTGMFKFAQIYRIKLPKAHVLHDIMDYLKAGKSDQARELALAQPAPVNTMLVKAVDNANRDKEYIEEVMYETLLDTQPRLEKYLPLIAITAATAPLLGLLGTVTGMIHTFKLITIFGTGDAKSLSSGISEALVTTEFGLIVAIPALILHALLSRKCQAILATMEKYAVIFSNGLASLPSSPPEPGHRASVPRKLEVA
ncbi:MAG: MotA/TolQ/ExbB proton channel family protein [Emcibacter sp.]|nr:MotA/TolQ/ExbB proton channel family protein [Emcibacter sp.]